MVLPLDDAIRALLREISNRQQNTFSLRRRNIFSKTMEYCPTGYTWITNHTIKNESFSLNENEEYSNYVKLLKKCREKYGDVQVTPAFGVRSQPLDDNSVAIYVPHPAVRRVNKTLARIMKKRSSP